MDISYLRPVFVWFNNSAVAEAIRDSRWLFPAVEAVHIVALCVLVGAIFLLNFRLLGVALRSTPVSRLARELAPWTFCALIIILATGLMLFSSEAMKCYESSPFQLKMALLFSAILFHFTIYRRVPMADGPKPLWGRLAATLSAVLWLGTGFAGRAIAFY